MRIVNCAKSLLSIKCQREDRENGNSIPPPARHEEYPAQRRSRLLTDRIDIIMNHALGERGDRMALLLAFTARKTYLSDHNYCKATCRQSGNKNERNSRADSDSEE